mmetsp:Transcript_69666/g.193898  ORF Transcript_69666/g.193898 Transcript_69666/m.193898 type:complete len:235 (+) Transcript_69666:628-1332(+)
MAAWACRRLSPCCVGRFDSCLGRIDSSHALPHQLLPLPQGLQDCRSHTRITPNPTHAGTATIYRHHCPIRRGGAVSRRIRWTDCVQSGERLLIPPRLAKHVHTNQTQFAERVHTTSATTRGQYRPCLGWGWGIDVPALDRPAGVCGFGLQRANCLDAHRVGLVMAADSRQRAAKLLNAVDGAPLIISIGADSFQSLLIDGGQVAPPFLHGQNAHAKATCLLQVGLNNQRIIVLL